MQSTIQKWGNSLALRIPKNVASDLGLTTESQVDLRIIDGKLEVVPVVTPAMSLDEMLDRISAENLHGPIDSGDPVGSEIW